MEVVTFVTLTKDKDKVTPIEKISWRFQGDNVLSKMCVTLRALDLFFLIKSINCEYLNEPEQLLSLSNKNIKGIFFLNKNYYFMRNIIIIIKYCLIYQIKRTFYIFYVWNRLKKMLLNDMIP